MDYKTVQNESQAKGEKNDCAVKAVTLATGAGYDMVHAMFKANGRKTRRGASRDITLKVMTELGYDVTNITDDVLELGRTVRSVERFLHKGTYLIGVDKHLLCLKKGQVEDWTKNRLHRVEWVLLVTKKGQLPLDFKNLDRVGLKVNKRQGVRQAILNTADRMWSQAGKPTEFEEVRALRIDIMNELQANGVNRATASNELGVWQKLIMGGK